VAKAGISGCNFADRTNGGRLTRDDQAYCRDGWRGRVSAAGMPANRAARADRIAHVRVPGRGPYASRVELNPVPENLRGDGQRDRRAPAPFRIRAATLIEVWDR
jgi:hypothetical protein